MHVVEGSVRIIDLSPGTLYYNYIKYSTYKNVVEHARL